MTIIQYDHPQALSVESQLMALAPRFKQALSGLLDEQRLIRSVMVAMDRNRDLFNVDPQSIIMAAMSAACVALEPDGMLGQGYLVPFKLRDRGRVAQFMTGYKGFVTLAARGTYAVRGECVRVGDDFEIDKASGQVRHVQKDFEGRITGAWSKAVSHHLPPIVEFVPIAELMELRARAKSTQSATAFSPWLDEKIGFPAMCRKTPVRRLARSLPLGQLPHFGIAAAIEEAVDERGLHAWADPVRGVQVGSTAESMPPMQSSQVPLSVTVDRQFPKLPPDLAMKAARLQEFFSTVTTVADLDRQLERVPKTLEQIKIVSPDDYNALAELIDKRRITLLELAESQTTR